MEGIKHTDHSGVHDMGTAYMAIMGAHTPIRLPLFSPKDGFRLVYEVYCPMRDYRCLGQCGCVACARGTCVTGHFIEFMTLILLSPFYTYAA